MQHLEHIHRKRLPIHVPTFLLLVCLHYHCYPAQKIFSRARLFKLFGPCLRSFAEIYSLVVRGHLKYKTLSRNTFNQYMALLTIQINFNVSEQLADCNALIYGGWSIQDAHWGSLLDTIFWQRITIDSKQFAWSFCMSITKAKKSPTTTSYSLRLFSMCSLSPWKMRSRSQQTIAVLTN